MIGLTKLRRLLPLVMHALSSAHVRVDCGLCVDECPVKAIYPEEDLPEEWQKYVQINIDYYKDK